MFISDGLDIRQRIAKLGVFCTDKQKIHTMGFGRCFYMKRIDFVIDIQAIFGEAVFSFPICDDSEIFFILVGKSHNQVGTYCACAQNGDGADMLIHNCVPPLFFYAADHSNCFYDITGKGSCQLFN